MLATSQPVRLDHARVIAKGNGIEDGVGGVRLTVLNSTFDQTDPGATVTHRAILLDASPASLDVEHNRFNDGDGIWIAAASGTANVNPLTVSYNYAHNIGRYPHPTSPNCCVQFVQLDHIVSPGIVMQWNHTQNDPGQSDVEDNINFYYSGGTDSTHRSDVSHNLIDGGYPKALNNPQYTGGGINIGDAGAAHNSAHDNTVVSTTNYGVAVHQTDNHAANNVLINDGAEQVSAFGQAMVAFQSVVGSDATGNKYNWRRDATASQFPCWIGTFCSGNAQVSTTEQQARDAWAASVPAGAQPIGPTP